MVTVTALPRGRALTVADIEAMPDDGQLYELIDGVLVVTPPPEWRHGDVVGGLFALLRAAAPSNLRVLTAPSAVIIDDTTWVEPDIFVAAKQDFGAKWLEGTPLLAIEVLSPSNRLYDLTTKFARYERAGIPSYWVVDPHELTMIVWELRDGHYVEVAELGPDEEWTAATPFEITVAPGRLTD